MPILIAIAAIALALLSLLLSFSLLRRVRAGAQHRPATTVAGADASIDAERLGALAAQLADISRRLAGAETQGQRAIQRVGVVRYNPFADTGSNQSFVLDILDARGDGLVLSSNAFAPADESFPEVGGRGQGRDRALRGGVRGYSPRRARLTRRVTREVSRQCRNLDEWQSRFWLVETHSRRHRRKT